MSTQAFLWSYRDGDVAALPFDQVRRVFEKFIDSWDPTQGIMRVWFGDDVTGWDMCDIFCGKDAEETNSLNGLMIDRPIRHPDFWRCVIEVMHLGHVLLFFSDNTTPLFVSVDAVKHFPADVLEELGTPHIIKTPDDIVRSFDSLQ